MNQTPNPKSPKVVNPRKRVPATLQASNTTTKYSDLWALFSVIASLLLIVVSFLTFCVICVQAGIYFFQIKQMNKSTDAAMKAANAAEASVKQARGCSS